MAEREVTNEYRPDKVYPPGDTLQEILEERDMSQAVLAERMGRPKKTINEIVKGKAAITPETALQLGRVLGMSSSFWINLESNYRAHLAEAEDLARINEEQSWAKRFPVKAMANLGWIKEPGNRTEEVRSLLSFFGVASTEQWARVYGDAQAAFRRSSKFDTDHYALSCWLRRGASLAEAAHCGQFDKTKFRETLVELRSLTTQPVEEAVPALQRASAESGVAVVFVRQLAKVPVSGATHWASPNRAVIQLTFRYKTDDHLWFTFFHEAGHIVLHSKKQVFLEGEDYSREGKEEEEADRFAADLLIPRPLIRRLLRSGPISRAKVQHFADSIGISPGVIVGRLQHEGAIPRTHLNGLKRRYDWSSIETNLRMNELD